MVLAAIGNFIAANYVHVYSIQGYFGFAYLTVENVDVKKKYKFDYNTETETVDRTEVPVQE